MMNDIVISLIVGIFASLIANLVDKYLERHYKSKKKDKPTKRLSKILRYIGQPIQRVYLTFRYGISYRYNKFKIKPNYMLKVHYEEDGWWRDLELLTGESIQQSLRPFDTELEATSNAVNSLKCKIISTPRTQNPTIHYVFMKSIL